MNAAQHILISGVRLYRWLVSPVLRVVFGPLARCRYEPSCSAYAIEALRVHGALKGSWLALKRIGRCQPWGSCGHDPVPEKKLEIRNPKSETNSKLEERPTATGKLLKELIVSREHFHTRLKRGVNGKAQNLNRSLGFGSHH